MHTYNFYKTIIKDWKKKEIDNAKDAYYYISNLYEKNKNKNISSEEWFDNYWKKVKEENK